MKTILFSFILILIIIWMVFGILYFYTRYVSPYGFIIRKRGKNHEDTNKNKATKEEDVLKGQDANEQTEFVLIGKGCSVSPIIPQMPSISSSEKPERNGSNFAPQNSEEEEDVNEEDNEVDVDFEMEKVGEDEVAHKELSLSIRPTSGEAEVSGQPIPTRDSVCLQKRTKNCEEADGGEVRETVRQLQDSEPLDKYKENIAKMQGEQASLLEKIRRAEEKEEQSNQQAMPSFRDSTPPVSDISNTSSGDADEKPLLYYL